MGLPEWAIAVATGMDGKVAAIIEPVDKVVGIVGGDRINRIILVG